jgi:hypothetical protein
VSFAARPTGYSGPTAPAASLPASLSVANGEPSGTSTASFTMNSNGTYSSVGNSGAPSGTWQTGSGTGSSYDVKVTVSAGAFDSGTTGSWLSLSSNRTWEISTTSLYPGESATATIEIRDASTLSVLASSNLSVEAYIGTPP